MKMLASNQCKIVLTFVPDIRKLFVLLIADRSISYNAVVPSTFLTR